MLLFIESAVRRLENTCTETKKPETQTQENEHWKIFQEQRFL